MGFPDYCGLHRPQLRPAPAWWPTLPVLAQSVAGMFGGSR